MVLKPPELRVVRRRPDETIELARVDRRTSRLMVTEHRADLRLTHASLRFEASGRGVLLGYHGTGRVLLTLGSGGATLRDAGLLPVSRRAWATTIDPHGWVIFCGGREVAAVDPHHRRYATFTLPEKLQVSEVSGSALGELVFAGAYEEQVGIVQPAMLRVALDLPRDEVRSAEWRRLDVPARAERIDWRAMRVGLWPRAMASVLNLAPRFEALDAEGDPWVLARSSEDPGTLSAYLYAGGPDERRWRARRVSFPGTPHFLRPGPGVVVGVDPQGELVMLEKGALRAGSIRAAVTDELARAGHRVTWPPVVLASDALEGRVALGLHFAEAAHAARGLAAVVESSDAGASWVALAVESVVPSDRPWLALAYSPGPAGTPYR